MPTKRSQPCNLLVYGMAIAAGMQFIVEEAHANPSGLTVASGTATTQTSGSQLTITTGNQAVLNWQSFNIGAGETTIFNQPSSSSIVVNNIHDASASQIYGSLQANGIVILINQNGFYIGPNSFISVGGLVMSTANFLPPQNLGGTWQFNGPPPLASIVNYGQINIAKGGFAYFIGDKIENDGDIVAPGGTIGLAAGQTVELSDRPDGRGLTMSVTLPSGSVNNNGEIVADAGSIALQAQVVNQNGLLQADSVSDQNGTIELVASQSVNLGANSQILARGDNSASGSAGGNVTIQSGDTFSDTVGSQIVTTGGANGGNGGDVEISAPNIESLNTAMNASAVAGSTGGSLLLDPINITLSDSSSATTAPAANSSGTVDGSSTTANDTWNIDVTTAFANLNFAQITLAASGNISLNAGLTWDLSGSTGSTSGKLSLLAGGDIIFGDGSLITDANNWSVNLAAGYNFTTQSVTPGIGNISIDGGDGVGGAIQTAGGNISLTAGQNITVGSGYVVTTSGGSIDAHALSGNIDAGSDAQGYTFTTAPVSSLSAAYSLNDGLGGIGTEAGGDVTLVAGGDVNCVLPVKNGYEYDGNSESPNNGNDYLTAGIGAYGLGSGEVGNVTVIAGGNVNGNYTVANGTGSIYAGVQMDANGNPVQNSAGNYVLSGTGSAGASDVDGTGLSNPGLALTLIKGGWNVAAAQDIYLQEVRNPNGDFDAYGGTANKYLFNYSANDYVNLSAGNLVQLGSSSLPRINGSGVPVVYPPILNITAGEGGVLLGASAVSPTGLTLFPSPQGSLTIDTSGSLVGNLGAGSGPQLFNLIVSDSGSSQYTSSTSFSESDNASSPVHLNSPTVIDLEIGGDMDLINLVVPESAHINVDGNMNNDGFQGMNISTAAAFQSTVQEADGTTRTFTVNPSQTSITAGGDIEDRSAFTSIDLSQLTGITLPDLAYLAQSQSSTLTAATLLSSFYLNGSTLTYQNITGQSLSSVLNQLNNLKVQVYKDGVPQWLDAPLDTVPETTTVSIFGSPTQPGTIAYALLAQYNSLGTIPTTTPGFVIGGGGTFDVTGKTIDLGTGVGIESLGAALFTVKGTHPLASLFGNGGIFTQGSDINVTTTGNPAEGLNSAGDEIGDLDLYSSSISSLFGGNISLNVSGALNAGSSVFSVNSQNVRGIYTTSGGDLAIHADGDINVNGSRIITYDGGNITVDSANGNITTGSGSSTPVSVTGYYEDPFTHTLYSFSPQIPFSGIAALTFPASSASFPAPTATLGNILVETPHGNVVGGEAGILQIALNYKKYLNAQTVVLAGYEMEDASGNPVTAGNMADATPVLVSADENIDFNGSGIIAENAALDASGSLLGFIYASGNVNATAKTVVAVVFGGQNVSVDAQSSSGIFTGGDGISVSGSSDASLLSGNVSGSTSGQSGLAQGTAANATSQAATSEASTEATATDNQNLNDLNKSDKGKGIALAQKVSRVTVLLPGKTN